MSGNGGEMKIEFRPPRASDAAAIWTLVHETPSLDENSPYAYLLLCSHFADTGFVALRDGELVGFVLGYTRPDDASTAFVWQVAVSERARRQRLGSRLLDGWYARCARRSPIQYLEATVTPSNDSSRALFTSFAERHGASLNDHVAYPADLFPEQAVQHEDEVALRIGPIPVSKVFAPSGETLDQVRADGSA